jgi:cytochrome c biogenesis protein CcmG, thiol:disulfide interchange protein DsbE
MAKKNRRSKDQKSFPYGPVIAGVIFIGIAILMLTSGNSKDRADSQGQYGAVPMAVDLPAPELALENINGETDSLAGHLGQVVLVNNWATWCPPCKAEMPTLEAYYEDHADERFVVIAVEAGEAKEDVAQFARDHNLKFHVWLDPHGDSTKVIGNGNLPNSYVIDRTGKVRYAWTGEVSRETLEKYVTPLLSE